MADDRGSGESLQRSTRDVLEGMLDGFVALDRDWRYVYVNGPAGELLGREPASLIGRHIWTEFPQAVGQPFHRAYEQAMREQRPIDLEEYSAAAGRWFETRVQPSPGGLSVFFRDVTDRRRAEQELARSAERYRVLAHAVSSVVWRTDHEGTPLLADRWGELTGRETGPGGVDPRWIETVHPDDVEGVQAAWAQARATVEVYDHTHRVRGADGGWHHVRVRGVPVLEDGRVREWVGVVFDITEQIDAEASLRRAALEDPLTGIANRALFLDRLATVLAHRHPSVAVVYVDLDRFKSINDRFGHEGGDRLLRTVADRLRRSVRPSDLVSRLSGDEFAVLCDELPDDGEAVAIAERICRALAEPVEFDERMEITAAVGVAYGRDDEGTHPEALLRAADSAMYRSKMRGGGMVEVFGDELRERLRERSRIETELHAGLDTGAVRLHFQPIVSLPTGTPTAVEALLRWHRPGGPPIAASDAVSVAEETGLIGRIGRMVLELACREAAAQAAAGRPLRMSVNVSARQLAQSGELVADVRAALSRTGLAPQMLTLEITEGVLMEDMRRGEAVLAELRALGVSLEVDDFAAGHSSLSYLHRLPIDAVKIDRSFIAGLPGDGAGARMLEGIVGLARAFGMRTTAEGVEDVEQLEALRAAGCDAVQGYHLARPVTVEELPAALEDAAATFAAARDAGPARPLP